MSNQMKFLSLIIMKSSLRTLLPAFLLMLIASVHFNISAQNSNNITQRLLIDDANLFTSAQRAVILDSLQNFAATTSNGIMVVTTNDLNGKTPMEAAYEIGQKSGLGTKEHNNGVVVLIKPKQGNSRGEMAIAVGYGLEGALPDAACKMIIMHEAIPEFKRNDYYTGVMNTLNVIMPVARGEYSIDNYGNDEDDLLTFIGTIAIIFGIFLIFIIIAGYSNNNDQNYRGGGGRTFGAPIIFPSRGIGFDSSDSGFGGFGGFGGGSFGGGGASGSW